MTAKKRMASGAGKGRKLKLKKETVKDLDPKGKASRVQGGRGPTVSVFCTAQTDTTGVKG